MSTIPKIDEENNVIGETTVIEAVKNGWPRRVIRIFLFDENRQHILLQKRNSNMPTFPDMWDQTVGGHVDVGESEEETAHRELEEELGIRGIALTLVTTSFRNEHGKDRTFDTVYKGTVSKDTLIDFDEGEVAAVKWVSIDEFEELLVSTPGEFVPPFVSVWKEFKGRLLE